MGLFDIFKRSRRPDPAPEASEREKVDALRKEIFGDRDETNYLGKAAMCEKAGLTAIKEKRFDDAWKCFHEQKVHYMGHANRSEFTPAQALALDASVSAHLANILRLESKHLDAFEHILYWVATSPGQTKAQEQKLKAYFNRAKIDGLSLDAVNAFIESDGRKDFRTIQVWLAEFKEPG